MYNLIRRIIGWKTIVKLHHFYLLNLWNILLGGLGNNTEFLKQNFSWRSLLGCGVEMNVIKDLNFEGLLWILHFEKLDIPYIKGITYYN